jgi:2'-5' RNA ligase
MLPDDLHARMAQTIGELARQHGAPHFEPHITLLSSISGDESELIARAAGLARGLAPFETQLTEAGYLDEYYRCLFVRVELVPALVRAREMAQQGFYSARAAQAFVPHVSLMYANLPASKKDEILDAIGRRFDLTARIERLALYCADGTPEEWRRVASFALGANEP